MSRKSSNPDTDPRPSEQLIADMQAKINDVIERAQKKGSRRSDDSGAFAQAAEVAGRVKVIAEAAFDKAIARGQQLAQDELKQAGRQGAAGVIHPPVLDQPSSLGTLPHVAPRASASLGSDRGCAVCDSPKEKVGSSTRGRTSSGNRSHPDTR